MLFWRICKNLQETSVNKQEAAVYKQEAAVNKQEAAVNKQEAAVNKQEAAVESELLLQNIPPVTRLGLWTPAGSVTRIYFHSCTVNLSQYISVTPSQWQRHWGEL